MLTLGDRGLRLNRPALVLEVLEFPQPAAGKERSVCSVKNHTEESAPWEGAVLSLLLPAQPPFVSERNQKPFRSHTTQTSLGCHGHGSIPTALSPACVRPHRLLCCAYAH